MGLQAVRGTTVMIMSMSERNSRSLEAHDPSVA